VIRLPRASDDAAGEASIAGLHRVGPTFLIADVDENESASKEKCSRSPTTIDQHYAHTSLTRLHQPTARVPAKSLG
jgi:hypothetical protein